jgi:hypothetical protein
MDSSEFGKVGRMVHTGYEISSSSEEYLDRRLNDCSLPRY